MRLRHAGSDLPPTHYIQAQRKLSDNSVSLRTPSSCCPSFPLVLDLLLDGSIPPHDVLAQQGPALHAAATAAASATLLLLLLLVPLPLLHAVLPCRTHVKARWEGRHGTAADWTGGRGKAWVGPVRRDKFSSRV